MDIAIYIYFVTVFLGIPIGVITRKYHTKPIRNLVFFLSFILLIELPIKFLSLRGYYQNLLYTFYGPIEYIFMGYLYSNHYRSLLAKKIVAASVIVYLVFSGIEALFFFEYFHLSYNFMLRSILIVGLVTYYIYELYIDEDKLTLSREPLLWISIGNFFFFTGVFFLMGLVAKLEEFDVELSDDIYILNPVLNIFLYANFIIAFLCKLRKQHTRFF
jgi:hypothetical protein